MSNPFGTNNYSGGKTTFVKRNRYKLKDGDNVYRILPAMGDLAAEGRWSVYYNVVFGFKTSEGKHRPFQSPQVSTRKGKVVTVEVHCAATDLINSLKEKLREAKAAGDTDKVAQLAKIVGDYPIMGVFTLNNDHYMNVIDRQGNVGQLELGHRAKLALQAEIDRVRKDEGFDPLSPDNGRFFNIRRTGKGIDTLCQVNVIKEKIDVPGVGKVERDLVHSVDSVLLDRLLVQKGGKWLYKEAANLEELYAYPTAEEVALIVSKVDILTGKSSGVDEVFGKKGATEEETTTESATSTSTQTSASEALPTALASTLAATVAATAQVASPAAPTPTPAEAVQAKATVKATEVPVVNTKTTAETVAAMTPDDFMKSMGINL